MRILYLSQYFPPEVGATQIRAYEMARGLVRAGHHVTMIAEFPNHPSGVIPPAYKGKLYQRAELDGIEVIRVWVKASPVKTFRTRMAFYVSFMLNAALAGLFLARGRYDVIYATSPPLFVGATGLALSFLRRAPLVFEVRDLWPESAVVLGELRNARAVRLATWLEETCYRRARLITVTSQEILDRLVQRGLPPDKLALVRNGANVELFRHDAGARQRVRAALGLQDRFVVLYAGLFGLAYELELVLEVARDLERDAPDVHLLLVGEGPTREEVQAYAATLGLGNVTFLPAQARERVPDYFNAADVSLVPIKEPNIFGMLPVKIYDSMACQVPVIVGATGEPRHIVQESDSGLAVDPGDGAQLRQAILSLRADPARRQRYGENGRQAVVARYSRQAQARQLEKLLRTIS
jgi:glycosyltransferase involved in cell wall biosynthesis